MSESVATDWAAAQHRFDALRPLALRGGGARMVDLAYANIWDGAPAALRAALTDAIESDAKLALQYTPYGGATVPRRVAAEALTKRTGLPYKFKDLVLTPGAMAALSICLRSEAGPGRRALISAPCWIDHPLYAAHQGLEPTLVPVYDSSFELDFKALTEALDERVAVVLLTNPGNPTGRCVTERELLALAQLLNSQANPPLLLVDECHRDYDFQGHFRSAACFYDRTISVYSYGKKVLAQGQRLGYAAVSPRFAEGRAKCEQLIHLARAGGYCTPTALMQRALPALEAMSPPLSQIAERRRRVLEHFERAGTQVAPCDATLFVFAKVSPAFGGDDWVFTEALARRGVLVTPGSLFHHPGWVRISCTGTEAMLTRGLEILTEVS